MEDKFLEWLEERLDWCNAERDRLSKYKEQAYKTSWWGVHMTKLCIEEVIAEYKHFVLGEKQREETK